MCTSLQTYSGYLWTCSVGQLICTAMLMAGWQAYRFRDSCSSSPNMDSIIGSFVRVAQATITNYQTINIAAIVHLDVIIAVIHLYKQHEIHLPLKRVTLWCWVYLPSTSDATSQRSTTCTLHHIGKRVLGNIVLLTSSMTPTWLLKPEMEWAWNGMSRPVPPTKIWDGR